jgi:hypothetical protein
VRVRKPPGRATGQVARGRRAERVAGMPARPLSQRCAATERCCALQGGPYPGRQARAGKEATCG